MPPGTSVPPRKAGFYRFIRVSRGYFVLAIGVLFLVGPLLSRPGIGVTLAGMSDALSRQLALTRQQIDQRAGMGDQLEVPRPTDHRAGFKKRDSAEGAAQELRALGYEVTFGRLGLRKVLLEASKPSSVELETAEAFTREVFGIVAKHGGDYDGWGGPVKE